MSRMNPACAPPEQFLALVAGNLSAEESAAILQHRQSCPACAQQLSKAKRIHVTAVSWQDPVLDDVIRQQLWEELRPRIRETTRRFARRHAWQVVLSGRRGQLALVAATVLVVLAVVLAFTLGRQERYAFPLKTTEATTVDRTPAGPLVRSTAPTMAVMGPGPSVAPSPVPAPQHPPMRPPRRPVKPVAKPVPGLLACGARMLSRQGQIQVLTNRVDSAVIRLGIGAVTLRVPRLAGQRRVEVVTADARVVVKGTRFTVRKQPVGGTEISVAEGVVSIYPTGRNRRTVVLGPGGHQSVLGEAAYLRQLLTKMQQAVGASDLHQAVRLARRYLAVTTRTGSAIRVRMTLAAALGRLGKIAQAVRIYRQLARSGTTVARQNALAFLARLLHRQKQTAAAQKTWQRLLSTFPRSIHRREALLALVRAACRSSRPRAQSHRRQLARHYPRDPVAAAALRRCRSPAP